MRERAVAGAVARLALDGPHELPVVVYAHSLAALAALAVRPLVPRALEALAAVLAPARALAAPSITRGGFTCPSNYDRVGQLVNVFSNEVAN